MRKRIKRLAALLLVPMLVLNAGCGEAGHVHSRYYVRAIAVSGNDQKMLAFDFYNEDAEPFRQTGESFDSIKKAAEISLGKEIFTGHTELILMKDCEYTEDLVFLLREWKVSPSCVVVYADGSIKRITESVDGKRLADSVRKASDSGEIPVCDITTVLSGLLSEKAEATAAKADEKGFSGSIIIKQK